MCGIAGIWGEGSRDRALLEVMASSLRHRGPDDQGIWFDDKAGLALVHRRLAIVDLSPQGHQPMPSHCGRWILCFNGEIYNSPAIRELLDRRAAGPSGGWRGHSDTETLVEAIASLGLDEALRQSVGMFACAIWDRRDNMLHLVRDRFGEKPLYFGWIGRDLAFASELKALKCHPSFDPGVSEEALAAFLATGVIPAPMSVYRGIHKLMPGCILTLRAGATPDQLGDRPLPAIESKNVTYRRYWDYAELVEEGAAAPYGSRAEAMDGVVAALFAAIDGQKTADVPIGAFLSGGIDSSTIAALYQQRSGRPISTFTIGYGEQSFDESPYARAVAEHLGTNHHEMIVTPAEARDVIPRIPAIYDEPFADSSQIPTYIVSQFARQNVTVALSGDGGDELFAGYNRHVLGSRFWHRLSAWPQWLRQGAGSLASAFPDVALSTFAATGASGNVFAQKVRKGARLLRDANSIEAVHAGFVNEWHGLGSALRSGKRWSPPLAPFSGKVDGAAKLAAWDALTYLPDDIMVKVDRASMAVSLETRAPFLDHRVAAAAARVPVSMKIDRRGGKAILRDILASHLPSELIDRPKTGFGIPVGEWLRGPLRDWAEHLLDPRRLDEGGWLDRVAVRQRWTDHLGRKRDSTTALWSILMFEAWRDSR